MAREFGAESEFHVSSKADERRPRPELAFEEVVMRVFPLRANINRLERFCDHYLNQDQGPSVRRPPMPEWNKSFFLKGVRIPSLNLKRIRDEEDPSGSCYEAVVAFERVLRGMWTGPAAGDRQDLEIKDLPGSYEVLIHDSPTFRLVERLGLAAEFKAGSSTAVCRVEHPFWLRADMRSELPTDLSSRSLTETGRLSREWQVSEYVPFDYFLFHSISVLAGSGESTRETLLKLLRKNRPGDDEVERAHFLDFWTRDSSTLALPTLAELVDEFDGGG